jgi:hypothetical protein
LGVERPASLVVFLSFNVCPRKGKQEWVNLFLILVVSSLEWFGTRLGNLWS